MINITVIYGDLPPAECEGDISISGIKKATIRAIDRFNISEDLPEFKQSNLTRGCNNGPRGPVRGEASRGGGGGGVEGLGNL